MKFTFKKLPAFRLYMPPYLQFKQLFREIQIERLHEVRQKGNGSSIRQAQV